jgi:hypothetical protein
VPPSPDDWLDQITEFGNTRLGGQRGKPIF